jgi:hypothetical protein
VERQRRGEAGVEAGCAGTAAGGGGVPAGEVDLAAPASNGSAITDYIIQRAAPGTAWTTVRDGVSTARSHVVTRLTNGTPYRFRVAAKNAVGIGLWSLVVRAVPRAT